MRIAAVVLCLALAVSPALAAKVSLPGQVTYREKIAVPPSAVLRIQLIDQSLASAPPRLDVQAPIGTGVVPLSFTLTFDDAIIIPDHSYALIAAISVDGGLMFRNFEPYPVDPLAPATPVLITTNMVAGPAIEPSSSAEPVPATDPAILNSTWSATRIGDKAIGGKSPPTLALVSNGRAGGSGGCNSWFAVVELNDNTIRFGDVAATKKSCGTDRDATEQTYFTDLAAAASWRVEADDLTLFGADGKPLLDFAR